MLSTKSGLCQQIPNTVNAAESTPTADAIISNLGGFINVTSSEIQALFSQSFYSAIGTTTCSIPDFSFHSQTPSSITFIDNNANPQATEYTFRVLNLETGTEDDITLPINSLGIYTIPEVSDGLHLFTFQSDCNESFIKIIIEDKIFARVLSNDDISCNCSTAEQIFIPNDDSIIEIGAEPYNVNPQEGFKLTIPYKENNFVSIRAVRAYEHENDGRCKYIHLNLTCNDEVVFLKPIPNYSSILHLYEKVGDNEILRGKFRTTTFHYIPEPGGYNPPFLTFEKCLESISEKTTNNIRNFNPKKNQETIQVFPNPTFNEFTVEYVPTIDVSHFEILIYDSRGRLLKRIKTDIAKKDETAVQNIDMKSYSSGLYHCIIQSPEITKAIRLVKY